MERPPPEGARVAYAPGAWRMLAHLLPLRYARLFGDVLAVARALLFS